MDCFHKRLTIHISFLDNPIKLPDWENYSADNAMRSLARLPLPFVFVEDNVDAVGTVARVS